MKSIVIAPLRRKSADEKKHDMGEMTKNVKGHRTTVRVPIVRDAATKSNRDGFASHAVKGASPLSQNKNNNYLSTYNVK